MFFRLYVLVDVFRVGIVSVSCQRYVQPIDVAVISDTADSSGEGSVV